MNADYQKILYSRNSLFDVLEEDYEKFTQLVKSSISTSNHIEERTLDNNYFFYLFRDLWFYLNDKVELKNVDDSESHVTRIHFALFSQIRYYMRNNPIDKNLLESDFNKFLIAQMIVGVFITWYQNRTYYNPKLGSGLNDLDRLMNSENSIEQIQYSNQYHEQIEIVTHEILQELRLEFEANKLIIFMKLTDVCKLWNNILRILMIIVGEKQFYAYPFDRQLNIYESLHKNRNLFKIVDHAIYLSQFLEKGFIQSIFDDVETLGREGSVEKKAPLIICPASTNTMFKNRHYINGLILALASYAKKLERDVYILPYSSGEDHIYYFENGQFTIKDIIDVGNDCVFGSHHYLEAINLATLFLRDDMNLKEGRLLFITDEHFNDSHTDVLWKEAFLNFKRDQKLFVTSIMLGAPSKREELIWFCDQMIYVHINEVQNLITTVVKD